MIIVWGIIVPGIPIMIILSVNKLRLQHTKNLFRFGYIYNEFKEKYFFWEIIRIYGRVFIIILANKMINYEGDFHICYGICMYYILWIYHKALKYCKPYVNKRLNKFDKTMISVTQHTVLLILLVKYSPNDIFKYVGLVIIYLLNLLFTISMIYFIFLEYRKEFNPIFEKLKNKIRKKFPKTK